MAFPFTGKLPVHVIPIYKGSTVTASGSFTALGGPGVLGDLVVFGGVMGALTITDNTAASGGYGNILHVATPATGAATTPTTMVFPLNVACIAGATVFTSAATQYYITYTRG